MKHCHNPAGALWFCFRDSLVETLRTVDKQRLIDAWQSQTARTSFYRDHILKKVAQDIDLVVASELFKVDFVMAAQSSSGLQIQVIFIESENIAASASHEVSKLGCPSSAAPCAGHGCGVVRSLPFRRFAQGPSSAVAINCASTRRNMAASRMAWCGRWRVGT